MVVVNDGSDDQTNAIAAENGAEVLNLPCNLGVGGAVQAGLRYAYEMGYDYVVRCDGDGQHPPSEIPNLIKTIKEGKADLVIGSRFLADGSHRSSVARHVGIGCIAMALSLVCRKKVTDPTSGFQAMNRILMYTFSRMYPMDYPEPEALALMRREGFDFTEVPVVFRQRSAGKSSIKGWGTLYYMLKVFLALAVDRARAVDQRYSKSNLKGKI